MLPSSEVMTNPVAWAAWTMPSASRGFRVGTWTRWMSMPSAASSSAAWKARTVWVPVAKTVASLPGRTTAAFPNSKR